MMASFTAGFEQEKRKGTKLSDLQGVGGGPGGEKVSAMGAAASSGLNAGTGMSALDAMAEQDLGIDTTAPAAAAAGSLVPGSRAFERRELCSRAFIAF